MDVFSRLGKLQSLMEVCNRKIEGRKKFHKLAYLAQEAGEDLGLSFIFHYYGVYSPALTSDIITAEQWKILKQEAKGWGYDISLNEESQVKHKDLLPETVELLRSLNQEDPGVLEVLSTIVYLDRKNCSGERLYSKLLKLKGHLQYVFPKAKSLAEKFFGIHLEELSETATAAGL